MAQRSNDEIWEKLGGLAADVRSMSDGFRDMRASISSEATTQGEHRRRIYERFDEHDDRLTAVETFNQHIVPKIDEVHAYVAEARTLAVRADGRKEVYLQAATWGGAALRLLKPALIALGLALAAFWQQILAMFGSGPTPPP